MWMQAMVFIKALDQLLSSDIQQVIEAIFMISFWNNFQIPQLLIDCTTSNILNIDFNKVMPEPYKGFSTDL